MSKEAIVSKAKPRKQQLIWQDKVYYALIALIVAFVLAVTLYPLYIVVIASVSEPAMVGTGQVTLYPKGFHLSGYKNLLNNVGLIRAYVNSVFYVVVSVVLGVAINMMAGFAMSRKYPGKKFLNLVMVIPMFFSGGLIPLYLCVRDYGLLDTYTVLIITGVGGVWNAMLVRTYITSTIPESLYEAAVLDGANPMQYFLKVIVPLSGTIMGVLCVYIAVGKWNDYWGALIYIRDRAKLPLQNILREMLASLNPSQEQLLEMISQGAEEYENQLERQNAAETAKYCLIMVSTIPAVILYLCMQKFFVKGVMVGSLKG